MTEGWEVPKGVEHGYQWGVYPPPGYEPVYLVPRPPRPGVVNLALILTYVGVLVAFLQFVISALVTWQSRESLTRLSTSGTATVDAVQTSVVLAIVITGVIMWLLPAAGAVVTAVLSRRGANPARVVLASLMGLFALVSLCESTAGAVGAGMSGQMAGVSGVDIGGGWVWANLALNVSKLALAVTIGVLLLVPATNRYFSPGPGRRFISGATPVRSTHDRS
jgi:hypothetical protein